MNKLSNVSRILIAIASLAFIAVFFFPVWRIDLFAPQYPEGLTMFIWINNITGEVDVINGLNHYIGMKHITVDMFPEFRYLPYVIGFFIFLGLGVAITGNRNILLGFLSLLTVGAALAMCDFYKWGYDYGHNLDPKAPIQVPGFSYQPPLFGHKQLLNFDAYSFPDVGGWVVIAAGLLAFSVWILEWYKSRKTLRRFRPISSVAVLLFVMFFVSCNTQPLPFVAGKDECNFCKMGISDTRYGGEVITKKGKVFKFDDLHCMSEFLSEDKGEEYAQILVINFSKPNTFLDVSKAFFAIGGEIKSPMGSNSAGFESLEAATAFSNGSQVEIIDWPSLKGKMK